MFGVPLLTHQLCDVPENARTPSDDPYLGVRGPLPTILVCHLHSEIASPEAAPAQAAPDQTQQHTHAVLFHADSKGPQFNLQSHVPNIP